LDWTSRHFASMNLKRLVLGCHSKGQRSLAAYIDPVVSSQEVRSSLGWSSRGEPLVLVRTGNYAAVRADSEAKRSSIKNRVRVRGALATGGGTLPERGASRSGPQSSILFLR
jgi:hypothetical protein